MKLAIIGQSHAVCVKDATMQLRECLARSGIKIDILLINNPAFKPWKEHSSDSELDGFSLIPALREAILTTAANADRVFSLSGGMAHNIFGLTNHERPFDFVLAEDPTLPLIRERELVPSEIVKRALMSHWNYQDGQWFLKAITKLVQQPVSQCESPPPIRSEARIIERAGVFGQEITKFGIAPASVRHKLWRLQGCLVKKQCSELGVAYLPVPPGSLDEHGFLSEKALCNDAVHANDWYGKCVLRQIVNASYPNLTIGECL